LENSQVKKVLARVASNQNSTHQKEETANFYLKHDHHYTSVKQLEVHEQQSQQDDDEMTGDDNNSIITLSSSHSATSDLITRHAAKNALKTLRTRHFKNSLPFQASNKNETRQAKTKRK
jgi:hypothetical protein